MFDFLRVQAADEVEKDVGPMSHYVASTSLRHHNDVMCLLEWYATYILTHQEKITQLYKG